jgi:hypothetical protein
MKLYHFFLLSAVAWGGGGGVGNRKPHSIAKLLPFFILSGERGGEERGLGRTGPSFSFSNTSGFFSTLKAASEQFFVR